MAVTSVNKISLVSDIWKNFRDRIIDQVTSVDITGSQTITIKNTFTSFPDFETESKDNYPIIIIESPSISSDMFTNGKNMVSGEISIEIYATQAEAAEKFLSKISNAIETYVPSLGQVGFRNVYISDSDSDSAERGQIKLHLRSITFSFNINILKEGY